MNSWALTAIKNWKNFSWTATGIAVNSACSVAGADLQKHLQASSTGVPTSSKDSCCVLRWGVWKSPVGNNFTLPCLFFPGSTWRWGNWTWNRRWNWYLYWCWCWCLCSWHPCNGYTTTQTAKIKAEMGNLLKKRTALKYICKFYFLRKSLSDEC